jgi:hypothetical protein
MATTPDYCIETVMAAQNRRGGFHRILTKKPGRSQTSSAISRLLRGSFKRVHPEIISWEAQMTELAQVLSRAAETKNGVESLKTKAIFSGLALLILLLSSKTYGLDLSVGFF